MRKAILIAANPLSTISDSNDVLGEHGCLTAHACHLVRHGGVFWDISVPGPMTSEEFPHDDIEYAYFYDVPTGTVSFRGEIELVCTPDDLLENPKYNWFLPPFRNVRESGFSYLILLRAFERLDRNYVESDFVKVDNGEPVRRVQNYVLIRDPEFNAIFRLL